LYSVLDWNAFNGTLPSELGNVSALTKL
jgi:hypothetical protein